MTTRRIGAVAAAAVLALGLAACGSDAGNTGGSGAPAAATPPQGLKIGIKFDQPGLGLKKGTEYTGFDVDVATYVAKELGTEAADITWVQAPSAQRETLIETGQVDLVFATYSITDKRKEKVSFAGPYFVAGQDLLVRADDSSITGPDTLDGKKLCSVTGSTSAQNVKDDVPGVQLQEFGLLRVPPGAGEQGARRADHRRHHPRRPRRAGRVQGPVQGRRQAVLHRALRRRPQEGRHRDCEKVNAAIKKMIEDGSWQKAIDANLGPANYKPGAGNPPTPDACS